MKNIIPLLLALLWFTSAAVAQTPTLHEQSTDMLKWELEMAESGYKLTQNPKTKGAVISVYEKMVNTLCMPNLLRDLDYDGNPTESECLSYIKRLLELHPDNPAALCAQRGIDDIECKLAYERQRINEFAPLGGRSSSNQFEGGLDVTINDAKVKVKVDQLMNEVGSDSVARLKRDGPKKVTEAYQKFKEALSLACRFSQVTIDAGGIPKNTPTPRPNSISSKSRPLDTLLGKDAEEMENRFSLAPQRTRMISSLCNKVAERALRFDAEFAPAICYRHGLYTPTCIKALRKAKVSAAKNTDNAVIAEPTKSFETF